MFLDKRNVLNCLFLLLSVRAFGQESKSNNTGRIDVSKIAGQSQEYITKYLGEPIKIDTLPQVKGLHCPCPQYTYADGLIKVVFNNQLADWVYIYTKEDLLDLKYRNEYADVVKIKNGFLIKAYTH